MCADYQGVVKNMADVSSVALAVGGNGGAAGPNGPHRKQICGRMVEQIRGQHQARAGCQVGLRGCEARGAIWGLISEGHQIQALGL